MFALAGCAGNDISDAFDSRQNAGPCPAAASMYDVSRYVSFKDDGNELYSNLNFTGEIVDVKIWCRYAGADPMEAEVEIDFAFGKGGAATENSHTYPYFVAVVRNSGKVLNKEYFAVQSDFRDGTIDGARELIAKITVPRVDETISGSNFQILVGFDLSQEQLEFNRAGKRFRLDTD